MIRLDDNTVFNPETGEFGDLPNIIQFEVDRTILTDSTPATVTWTVSNATKVLLNNEIVEPTGEKGFHSYDLFEVILITENELGKTSPRKITIDIDRTPPVIHSFSINKKFAIKGSPIKLTWNIEGYHSLSINNGVGLVTGLTEKLTTLGENGVYTLTAKNFFGISAIREAAISIYPAPIFESLKVPIPDFNSRLNLNTIEISSPKIDVSIDLNSIYSERPKFTEPSIDLKSIKATYKERTSIFNLSRAYEAIRRKISWQ